MNSPEKSTDIAQQNAINAKTVDFTAAEFILPFPGIYPRFRFCSGLLPVVIALFYSYDGIIAAANRNFGGVK